MILVNAKTSYIHKTADITFSHPVMKGSVCDEEELNTWSPGITDHYTRFH